MKFLKTKSDQNIHQNSPNCTILKNFLGGAYPRTPLAKRMASPCAACRYATCKFPNRKKIISWPPPLPNPGDAPDNVYTKFLEIDSTQLCNNTVISDVLVINHGYTTIRKSTID